MKISVVIRTRNQEKYFTSLLKNLANQSVQASEIIVVDNYSTNEKLRILEKSLNKIVKKCFGHGKTKVKLVSLSDDEFSHSYSTNLGVYMTENELICITNAHSLPISLNWLQDGIRHFEDGKVAGVGGYFIPHRQETVGEKISDLLYHFSQKIVLRQNWCSTINCIIRRSLWEAYPFDENLPKIIPETKKYGLEDYDWSKEMIARGFKIIVDPAFSVFHSHSEPLKEIVRNVKGYFVYRRIQQKINLFKRPRKSFSRVFKTKTLFKEVLV